MIKEIGITVRVVKPFLQRVFSNFIDVICKKGYTDVTNLLNNEKVDKKIVEVAEFLTGFEEEVTTPFLTDLQAAFSEENIRSILKEIRQEITLDLESVLQNELIKLCDKYRISDERNRIIDTIIETFFELTVVGNPELANRLFYYRLYEQDNKILGMLQTLDLRTEMILRNQLSDGEHNSTDESSSEYHRGPIVGSDDDLFEWRL